MLEADYNCCATRQHDYSFNLNLQLCRDAMILIVASASTFAWRQSATNDLIDHEARVCDGQSFLDVARHAFLPCALNM
jgi:hypothetical protein